jgi:SAM-dependent methyltransferase
VNPCKICQCPTEVVGISKGKYIRRDFELRRCSSCRFAFIANPHENLEEIYGPDYYAGKGADPLVDYDFELLHPQTTIRQYEWRGIERLILDCVPVNPSTRWLDFGCGTGGLVRHCHSRLKCQMFGYDTGDVHGSLKALGERLLTDKDLEKCKGSFDVITAIEVLEHVPDPLSSLRLIRSLLKPGGLFWYTTGNAQPFANNILDWRYLIPEIHISLFEPSSLEAALKETGFRPDFAGFRPGFEDVIRFKVLKNLGIREAGWWERRLPWKLLSGAVDLRYKVTAHPRGWAV